MTEKSCILKTFKKSCVDLGALGSDFPEMFKATLDRKGVITLHPITERYLSKPNVSKKPAEIPKEAVMRTLLDVESLKKFSKTQ